MILVTGANGQLGTELRHLLDERNEDVYKRQPFEFKSLVNGKDTLVGADIELAKAIGKKLGVKVEFSVMSFDNVLASVQSGKADIAIAGISVTDERKKVYDFSDSYYTSENVVIVKKDKVNDYTSTDLSLIHI